MSAGFVVSTKYEDIPGDVIELGKKSILDGWAWRWPDRERKPERFVVITLSILGSAMEKLPSSALQRKHLPLRRVC